MRSGWRIEAQLSSVVTFLLSIALMQIGGIPAPLPHSPFGVLLWAIWMATQFFQLLLILFAHLALVALLPHPLELVRRRLLAERRIQNRPPQTQMSLRSRSDLARRSSRSRYSVTSGTSANSPAPPS